MSDETEFLKAIVNHPAERSTRLVYADWLDENGRPREAEFLRLQIRIAEMNARLIELGSEIDVKWLVAVGAVSMEYASITLRTKREIRLLNLRQHNVYAGLLEGRPTRQINQRITERLMNTERDRGATPYLVEPPERLIERREAQPFPFGTSAQIPSIACIGLFDSHSPARDASRVGSGLTIIWFQDEYAFPIAPGVREQIRAIDWDRHAEDYDW